MDFKQLIEDVDLMVGVIGQGVRGSSYSGKPLTPVELKFILKKLKKVQGHLDVARQHARHRDDRPERDKLLEWCFGEEQ
jgi:hypothetical protein